jgi:hypothetical protein
MGAGLRRGKLLDQAKLVLLAASGAGSCHSTAVSSPTTASAAPRSAPRDAAAPEDRRAAFENDLYLRLADVDDAVGVIDRLFAEFCRARAASSWRARTLPALRAWVDEIGR